MPTTKTAVIVDQARVDWLELQSLPGVRGKLLAVDRSSKAHCYLVEYAPGTVFPRHAHPCLEHIYILAGAVQTDGETYGAGTHLLFPAGVEHGPFENREPLTELVVFEGMSGLEEMVPEIKELFQREGLL